MKTSTARKAAPLKQSARKAMTNKQREPRDTLTKKVLSKEGQMLSVFRTAATHVPAYQRFLKEHAIAPASIRTLRDFTALPPVTKDNYLRAFPWKDLCMMDSISKQPLVLTATSGSTGKPSYFPRTSMIDEHSYEYHRAFLERSKLDPKKPTLVIVAFGMGVWIGGIITYEAFRRISERYFPVTLLTAGVNKKEIFDALRSIGEEYSQLIVCGYPPFIKDVVDEGPGNGVSWERFDMRVVCAAEGFSEDFRSYIMHKTGMRDPFRSIMNIYGSAELGTMATETPLTILVRKLTLERSALFEKIFSEATRLPTLAQYVPSFVSFEAVDRRIYCTAGNALPLVRYEIGDHGGVLTFSDMCERFSAEGLDLLAEAKRVGIAATIEELPFVYIYERADLSTKLYGAIIFPEHVKHALMSERFEQYITTKFTMSTKNDEKQDEYLEISIELKKGVQATESLKMDIAAAVQQSLCEKSAEHLNNTTAMGARVHPRIVFWEHNHPEHFSHGAKHKWVKKA